MFWVDPASGQEVVAGGNSTDLNKDCIGTVYGYRIDLPVAQEFIQSVLDGP